MAIHHPNEPLLEHHENASFFLDALYCDEERWEEEEEEQHIGELTGEESDVTNDESLLPLLLLEQDLFWEDEELHSLFSKERKLQEEAYSNLDNVDFLVSSLSVARREAVQWMLKANAHYGFTTLTATLAINYLDRFLLSFHFQREEPWMIQLVAVTCLALAAKVEEIQVPPLLEFQVEDAKPIFEAKFIQKMELLVLSALKWKMHPVTPLSFLDHIIRRLGLKTHLHWEFLRRCEHLILSVLSDSRFVACLPSVLATATMLHVIDQIDQNDGVEYKKQLLDVLKINKEKVDECYNLIHELSHANNYGHNNPRKRKYDKIPGSPSGVMDAIFSSDASNDSWTVGSSLYSSSPEPLPKKSRAQEQQQQQQQQQQQMKLSPLNRVIVGIVGTSP